MAARLCVSANSLSGILFLDDTRYILAHPDLYVSLVSVSPPSIAFFVYLVLIVGWGISFVATFNAGQFIANMQAVCTPAGASSEHMCIEL